MSGRGEGAETVHATCVAIEGRAVLIAGRSGAGKSDLTLRLIDRGARLVSDDYTEVRARGGRVFASAPAAIRDQLEVRGIGLVAFDSVQDVAVALVVDLDAAPERLPEAPGSRLVAGLPIAVCPLVGLEPSAPLKLELALRRFGLPL